MNNISLTIEDFEYLKSQTFPELTKITGQMTALLDNISNTIDDTDRRVAAIENQKWYERMIKTLFGTNKASLNEIKKNQDKVVMYVSEALSNLYQLNCFESKYICCMDLRINQAFSYIADLYRNNLNEKVESISKLQKDMLIYMNEFVCRFHAKVESIDNFHMLIEEIRQKKYCNTNRLECMLDILAQLDLDMLKSSRKIDILRDEMIQNNVVDDIKTEFKELLKDLADISNEKIGIIYHELYNYRKSSPANIMVDLIELYNFLPDFERTIKNVDMIIESLMKKHMINGNVMFSNIDLFNVLLYAKEESLIIYTPVNIETDDQPEVIIPKTVALPDVSSLKQDNALNHNQEIIRDILNNLQYNHNTMPYNHLPNESLANPNSQMSAVETSSYKEKKSFDDILIEKLHEKELYKPALVDPFGPGIVWNRVKEYKNWWIEQNEIFGNARLENPSNKTLWWGWKRELPKMLSVFDEAIKEYENQ